MQGELSLQSELGKGSSFSFNLHLPEVASPAIQIKANEENHEERFTSSKAKRQKRHCLLKISILIA